MASPAISEISLQQVELNHLRLNFGATLQIQLAENPERYHVRLVGYLDGRSIITTLPVKERRLVALRTGQKLNVRMMVNDQACAFVTEVLHGYRAPYPHVHLKYPEDLVTNNVRKAARVETRVDGTLVNNSIGDRAKEIRCHLADISETGAHLVTPLRIGKTGDQIALSLQLRIGDILRVVNVKAILRGRLKNKGESGEREIHYGVEFLPLSEDQRIELIAFVYSKLSC